MLGVKDRVSWDAETEGRKVDFPVSFPPTVYHQDLEQGLWGKSSVSMSVECMTESSVFSELET